MDGSNFCKKCGNKLAGIENNNFAQNGKSPNTSNRNSSNKKTIISIIVVALVIIGLMVTLYLLFFDNSFFRDEEKNPTIRRTIQSAQKLKIQQVDLTLSMKLMITKMIHLKIQNMKQENIPQVRRQLLQFLMWLG